MCCMTQALQQLLIGYEATDYDNPDGDHRPLAIIMVLTGGAIQAYVDMDAMRAGTPLRWEMGSGWEHMPGGVALAAAQRSAFEWGLVRLRRTAWASSPVVTGDCTVISVKAQEKAKPIRPRELE